MPLSKKYVQDNLTAADPEDHKSSVLFVSTQPLAAYTRTANEILADAVGAMAAQDGIIPADGQEFLFLHGADPADNGIWVIDEAGDGATQFRLTRRSDADRDQFFTSGMRVPVTGGARYQGRGVVFHLVTPDPIVLNTTPLDFEPIETIDTIVSSEPITLYVDGDTGDDENAGTSSGSPLKTRDGAFERIPLWIRRGHPVIVRYASAATPYVMDMNHRVQEGVLLELADDALDPTVYEEIATDTAEAGTTSAVVKASGLTPDAWNGMSIEFTSGAAVGQRRQILSNDATDVVPMIAFSPAPADGDDFRIFRADGVQFRVVSEAGGTVLQVASGASAFDLGGQDPAAMSGHAIVGVLFNLSSGLGGGFAGGSFHLFGTRATGTGWLQFSQCVLGIGADPNKDTDAALLSKIATLLGLADNAWAGWGHLGETGVGLKLLDGCAGRVVAHEGACEVRSEQEVEMIGRYSSSEDALNVAGCRGLRIGSDATGVAQSIVETSGTDKHAIVSLDKRNGCDAELKNVDLAAVDAASLRLGGRARVSLVGTSVTGDKPSGSTLTVECSEEASVLLTDPPVLGDASALDWSVGNGGDQNKSYFASDLAAMINTATGARIAREVGGGLGPPP